MGRLAIAIFLLLLLGTILSQKPRKGCNTLEYKDEAILDPTTGFSVFSHVAHFSNQLVYRYDQFNHEQAKLQPRWENVENWDDMSQLQKARKDLIMNDLKEFANPSPGDSVYLFSQYTSCELCPNGTFGRDGHVYFESTHFLNNNWNIKNEDKQDSVAEMNQDPGAVTLSKDYLEKQCFATLQKYQNYRNTH